MAGFFSLFDTTDYNTKEELDRGGFGQDGTYEQRTASRNRALNAELAARKQAQQAAEQAAFQKQANPLNPAFVQGLAPQDVNQPEQNPYEHMQRRIYG